MNILTEENPKWNDRYLNLAFHVSEWSKDPSTKVGAVITKENRVVSLGFNGIPERLDDGKYLASRDIKILCVQHAESNAIDNASIDLTGSSIYITHAPCPSCSGRIIQNRISTVYTKPIDRVFAARWNFDLSEQMLKEAGVSLIELERNE